VPGNFVPQPVYAPALVAFIEDPGIGPSAPLETGPAVGWFPLAPGEVYWPNYTRDPVYIRNVNIANVSVTNITEIKTIATARRTDDPPPQVANQQFANRGAATVVPARIFADSGRVAPAASAGQPPPAAADADRGKTGLSSTHRVRTGDVAYFMAHAPRGFFPLLNGGELAIVIAASGTGSCFGTCNPYFSVASAVPR
jgi:hypothetical protein